MRARRLGRLAAEHRGLTALLAAGLLLRALVMLTYFPALRFPDSFRYLEAAHRMRPDDLRPFGYSLLLRTMTWTGSPATITVVQHVMGLALTVGVYAFLLHRGAPRWLALLAAGPVALDAYQLQIEQYVLAETFFLLLLATGFGLLLWSDRPRVRTVALAGFVLVAAGLTRTVGLPLFALGLLYLLVRRLGRRRVVAFAAASLAPLGVYMLAYHAAHGEWAVTGSTGRFLYGRVAVVADCNRLPPLPPDEQVLCDPVPPRQRTEGSEWYDWNRNSPAAFLLGRQGDLALRQFAITVMIHQPLSVAKVMAGDVLHYFAPGRATLPADACQDFWQFQDYQPTALRPCSSGDVKVGWLGVMNRSFDGSPTPHLLVPTLARVLYGYQRVAYTPGPLLAVCLGVVGLAMVRRRRSAAARRAYWDGLLLGGAGVALVVIPSATAVFDYRYLLPLIVLLPVAAALALVRLGVVAPGGPGRPGRPERQLGAGDGEDRLPERRLPARLQPAQYGYDGAVPGPQHRPVLGGHAEQPHAGDPGQEAERVHVVQPLGAQPGRGEHGQQGVQPVAPLVPHRPVEPAHRDREGGNEQHHSPVGTE